PVTVSLAPGVSISRAAAGDGFSLAATSAGQALAWGDDSAGELGHGSTTSSDVPVPVSLPSGTTVTQVAAGMENFALALTSAGQVLAWGDNTFGELGNGSTTDSDIPVAVSLPSGTAVTQVAAGGATSYALTSAGAVYAWGSGAGGTLGNGGTSNSGVPSRSWSPTARSPPRSRRAPGGPTSG
ncbi:MAG: RCC1 domain-containing protein, partial [Streptosporangiaceae bacterium]